MTITLDRKRKLLYNADSLCQLEEALDIPLFSIQGQLQDEEKLSMKLLVHLLWAGLIHEDELLTVKEVQKFYPLKRMGVVMEMCGKALSDAMPSVEDESEKGDSKKK